MTETNEVQAWVLYDGDCGFCRGLAERLAPRLPAGYRLAPLQTDWVAGRLGLSADELLKELRVLTSDGRCLGGAEAVLHLASLDPWTRPLAWLGRLPGARGLLDAGYRWVAARRGCVSGACRRPGGGLGGLVLCLAVPAAVLFGRELPPWGFMWLLAGAVFAGLKAWTLARGRSAGLDFTTAGSAGYLLLWPGMDPRPFARGALRPERPAWSALLGPALNVAAGAFLIWGCAPLAWPASPSVTAWLGMAGLVLVLHFGSFAMVSWAWRRSGVDARPLMDAPLRSASLSEFWSRRWNTAFRDLAFDLAFAPLAQRLGTEGATLAVFLLSGLVHDLVISLPAGGGYGLPTAYFLAQGAGLLAERSRAGGAWAWARGPRLGAAGPLAGPSPGWWPRARPTGYSIPLSSSA